MDASASASMPAKSGHSLQADLPATVGPPVDTQGASAPWSLLPGPLRAAIANAMTTEGAQPTPAGLAKSHPPTAPTPAMRPGPVLCKAGSVAHGASKGKGNKRSRADSQSHDALSGREGITGRPAGPGAVAADAAVLRQQADSAAHTKSGVEAAPSAAALKVVVSSGAAPCISHITEGPKLPDDTAADSVRTTGSVMDGARKHEGLPSMQQSVNKVRSSQARSISTDPVKGGLPSGSGLNSSVPPELQAVAIQRGSDVNTMPAEHCSVVAQHTVQKQNGADAGAVALCQTPVSNAIGDVTLSLAGSRTTDLCTGERLAKDALLMLHDKGSPTSMLCEDILTKLTSGQAVSQPPGDFIRGVERPPPFVDVEGASAFEVDRVIDKRYYKAGSQVRVQYLVRWKGYGPDDDTWQSRNSLRHAQEAVQDYEDTH